ncbi:MAG: hypothetical protein AAGE59_35525 [Cyanobacteria bacterium P01_F01_bin.86]
MKHDASSEEAQAKTLRGPTDEEIVLLQYLLDLASIELNAKDFMIVSMADGGMGSVSIGTPDPHRSFGRVAAECCFNDSDGTLVFVCLNLDQYGAPFEMDVWKVAFSPLVTWPARDQLRVKE